MCIRDSDNVTTEGWRSNASAEDVAYACRYLRCTPEELTEGMICACIHHTVAGVGVGQVVARLPAVEGKLHDLHALSLIHIFCDIRAS